jgi:DNA-binding XRE family transcriptional regulator
MKKNPMYRYKITFPLNRLKELRLKANMTQRDVCKETGIPPGTYSGIEYGVNVHLSSALKLAQLFNLSVEQIWEDQFEADRQRIQEMKKEEVNEIA